MWLKPNGFGLINPLAEANRNVLTEQQKIQFLLILHLFVEAPRFTSKCKDSFGKSMLLLDRWTL
jgi:hypothetical protein